MKIKKTFKEAFGKNPWDPWSTKANITEDGLLDRYLLSRGLNPSTVSKDMKIAHSKSNQFKQWAANQKEEVEIDDNLIEAAGGQLHRYLLSRGLDPMHVSKDSKIAHAKSNQFKQWAMSQREEVEQIDELKTGTLMRYSTKANQALVGGDRNKEDRRIQSINRAIQKIKSRHSKPAGDIQVDVKNKKITKNEEVELEEGSLHDWFGKEKWVRMDTKGNIKGQCAKEPGEGKPKCLPQAKAHALGKEGRAKAAQRKRREDPHAERSGKAINVRTEETAQIDEKKDACYHKVKSRYKVWPSAYASGALVKCRKAGAKNWGNKSEENELNESLVKKVVASAALAAAAASPHAHAQDKEPTQHPSNPHLIAHVEHGNKVSRFDLEKMFKSHEDATEHMTKALKKHGITNHIMHITNKHNEDELPTYAAKHKDYMDKTPAVQKVSHSDYSDNKPYVAKRSDKNYMSTESVSDKLHSQHQALRKKSGLPHPDYYKELGKSYDISDDKERMAKQSEIKKKYSVESVLYDDPKGTLTRVSERKKELSRSARIIKALYKKKGMKEDTYDWEKDDKSTSSYGKKPKMSISDDKASRVKKESDAAAVLSGGTTLTKQKRDIVELDPRMKLRPNKDAQDADDNNTN